MNHHYLLLFLWRGFFLLRVERGNCQASRPCLLQNHDFPMPQQESEVVLNACDAFSERRNWVLLDLMFTGEGLFS